MLLQFSAPCITFTAVRASLEHALPGFRIRGDNASFSTVERGSRFIEAMKTRSRSMTNDLAGKLGLDEPVEPFTPCVAVCSEPYRFHKVRHRHAAGTYDISNNPHVSCWHRSNPAGWSVCAPVRVTFRSLLLPLDLPRTPDLNVQDHVLGPPGKIEADPGILFA